MPIRLLFWERDHVSCFFVISGYLIYSSYDRMKRRENGIKQKVGWIVNRLLRLLPLWYLSIGVHILTHGWSPCWLGTVGKVTLGNIIAHLFFLHGLFPYYTDSLLGVDGMLMSALIFQWGVLFEGNSFWGFCYFTIWGISYAILFVSQKIHAFYIIDNPIMRLLGKYSYAIYLFHYQVFIRYYNMLHITIGDNRIGSIVRIILVTVVSLGFGIAVTKWIEVPFVEKIRKYNYFNIQDKKYHD